MVLKLECAYKSPEDADSDSIGLEWDQEFCSQVMLMVYVPAPQFKHQGARKHKRRKNTERKERYM